MLSKYLRLKNWNVLSKIIGINLIILFVSFSSIVFYIIPVYETSLLNKHRNYLQGLVNIVYSELNQQYVLVGEGEITEQEAKRRAIETVKVIANKNDYFWIHDLNLVMVAHPFVPALENTSLAAFRDSSGRLIFNEMNNLVTASASGQGFIEYNWPKPGGTVPVAKISCVRLFKPWGWVVGSGLYYDDIKAETTEIRIQVFMVAGVLLTVIICFSFYAANRINQPLRHALEITRQITRSHIAPEDEKQETSNEPQLLLNVIEKMVTELKDAKDEAERANQAKSDFLARMSHEIRTPINAVVGMTELAMEIAASLEQKEYLEGVRSSAEHLTKLINDVLDFSKIEAGQLTLEQVPFSLKTVLDDSLQPLLIPARQKGISCKAEVMPQIPDRLLGDPLRLRQVITNLVYNAIKFTSEGSVHITANESSRSDKSIHVAISISDTGIGIPEDIREKVFQPFTQGDGSFTRKYGGTGLGLSIVRQLVELMGGNISVTSEPGVGSTFCFTARFGLVDETEAPPLAIEHKEAVVQSHAGRSMSVLVAEDVELNQVLTVRFLEKLGHHATVVSNGIEAVEAFKNGSFDLVLMDVQMPDMDGLQATRIIREYESSHGGNTPIIAMTAHVLADDIANCLEAGMNCHLGKPLRRAELAKTLEKFQPLQ